MARLFTRIGPNRRASGKNDVAQILLPDDRKKQPVQWFHEIRHVPFMVNAALFTGYRHSVVSM